MLEYVAAALRGGERVLDYGCGSGILAVAAAKLGASEVDGVDIDPQSVLTTTENAARNGVTVRASLPEQLGAGVYDVVLANILAQPLILLAPLLASRVARSGRIALSGVLETQAEEVAAAYAPLLDRVRVAKASEGWALVEGIRA
jgi:ribosomal protein L11 methyltransferase